MASYDHFRSRERHTQQVTSLERRYPSSCCLYGGTVGCGCTSEATERFARPRRQCKGATYFLLACSLVLGAQSTLSQLHATCMETHCLNSLLAGHTSSCADASDERNIRTAQAPARQHRRAVTIHGGCACESDPLDTKQAAWARGWSRPLVLGPCQQVDPSLRAKHGEAFKCTCGYGVWAGLLCGVPRGTRPPRHRIAL